MRVCLLTITYNESLMIRQFLEHYSWCDKIIIYDNYSTDNTLDIAKLVRPDIEIFKFDTDNKINNKRFLEIKNNAWKLNRDFDFVVVVDVDEYLHNPFQGDVLKYLKLMKSRGISVIPTIGFDVHFPEFSSNFPEIFMAEDSPKFVSFNPLYGKCAIFNPSMVEEIGYDIGAHEISPKGNVKFTQPHLYLLHFRYFGFSYWKSRNDEYSKRVSHHIPGASFYIDQQNRINSEEDYRNEFQQNLMSIPQIFNLKGHRKK